MTSTEIKLGLSSSTRPSSRVLKPPGGGHTSLFGEAEVSVNAPRPKYNQQNSTNLNACIGSTDPNQAVEKLRDEITHTKSDTAEAKGSAASSISGSKSTGNANSTQSAPARGRVPPGGYSSGGFW